MDSFTGIAVFLLTSLLAVGGSAMPHGKFGMPASCAGSDYCTERHELYPQAIVNSLMETTNISFSDERPILPPVVIHREGEERDCEVFTTEDPIYEIVDAAGDVRVVVQTADGFRQKVAIERCLKPGHIDYATTHFELKTVKALNMYCIEQKLDVGFVVLTNDWKGMEMVKPKTGIPVGCDCKIF